MKIIIPIIFLCILASLGSALFFMMRDKGSSSNMVRSLFIRISLSLLLFATVWIAHSLGWIQSTGIKVGQ
ncbi:membrane protein [Polynucleobacter sp. SHI8]|uniref:twin transmembrane helix small protein n=1 Tax=unclassified Polynucleobacter TaxID=2640945 RepID=UPI00249233F0|nr:MULTISPECIES: twin transmembrane helix small protein [unclassified Polynucleobacter]BDW12148.1 membrane protein [Polynucleobacter sp. SHI2]BDW14596.1 membrane protein [Polynucleobacter sp. SHI8]